MVYRLLSDFRMVCGNFILPELCKPCLFLCSIQFAQLILHYLLTERFIQTGGQILFQISSVSRLAAMHLWFLHGQRNELLHRDIQCGGQLHECTGTASGERCLAGADVRQGCPRHTAFLGELVAGKVLFPQYLLDRHIHHRFYYIGTPIISQEKTSHSP